MVKDKMTKPKKEKDTLGLKKVHKSVLKTLKTNGAYKDSTTIKALNLMLMETLQMIPTAKKVYKKDPRQGAAFSYTALVKQSMELLDALRCVSDAQQQVEYINEEIINRAFSLFVSQLYEQTTILKRSFVTELGDKEAKKINRKLDDLTSNLGIYLKSLLQGMSNQVREYMIEPQASSTKKKKG